MNNSGNTSKELWTDLHKESRYRPKYPSENVVQFVFRNFVRNGETKVLDLGCGAGRHVAFMAKEKLNVYGLDYSSEGVSYTKMMLEQMGYGEFADNIKEGSLVDIPFEDNMFAGIVCYGVLYYLNYEDIKKAVREMYRVMAPGGIGMIVIRSTGDYRCGEKSCIPTDEKNTYIINEENDGKCAHSENGMLMHFFTVEEIKELFAEFAELDINKVDETHDNMSFKDSNYVVIVKK